MITDPRVFLHPVRLNSVMPGPAPKGEELSDSCQGNSFEQQEATSQAEKRQRQSFGETGESRPQREVFG